MFTCPQERGSFCWWHKHHKSVFASCSSCSSIPTAGHGEWSLISFQAREIKYDLSLLFFSSRLKTQEKSWVWRISSVFSAFLLPCSIPWYWAIIPSGAGFMSRHLMKWEVGLWKSDVWTRMEWELDLFYLFVCVFQYCNSGRKWKRYYTSSLDFTEILRKCLHRYCYLILQVEMLYLKQNQYWFITLMGNNGQYLCTSIHCLQWRRKMKCTLSVALRSNELMVCTNSFSRVFHDIWWTCISISWPQCLNASAAKQSHSVSYPQTILDLWFPASPVESRMLFFFLIDKRLAVKFLYGDSWSNRYKSSGGIL